MRFEVICILAAQAQILQPLHLNCVDTSGCGVQGRDLESAFEAGPASSSGQQEGHEGSFKGVGTFQVDASDRDRLLRKDRPAAKACTALPSESGCFALHICMLELLQCRVKCLSQTSDHLLHCLRTLQACAGAPAAA